MKKSILLSVLLIVLMLVMVLTGCPSPANTDSEKDPVLEITDAASLYKSLTGEDITKDVEPLVVVNAKGIQTTIDDSQLTSVRKARSAYNSRGAVNASSLGWHPLKKAITTYSQPAELICITQYSNELEKIKNRNPFLKKLYENIKPDKEKTFYFEDSKKNYTKTDCITPGDGSIFGIGDTLTIKGDFDGDGTDEIICMFFNDHANRDEQKYRYSIYNDGWQDIHELTETFLVTNFCKTKDNLFPGFAYDLDNDNCDELVIPSTGSISDGKASLDINVFKLSGDTLVKQASCAWKISDTQYNSITNMAAGDIDNDGIIEIVTCVAKSDTAKSMFIWKYNSSSLTLSTNPTVDFEKSYLSGCLVYIGGFLTDTSTQVLCYQLHENLEDKKAYIFNGITYSTQDYSVPVGAVDKSVKAPIMADFDIDGKMELATRRCIINFSETGDITKVPIPETTFIAHEAGDVDNNGRPDIICLDAELDYPTAYGFTAAGEWSEVKPYEIGNTFQYTDEKKFIYVLANIDDDSLRVKYVGHELKYSEPIPLCTSGSAILSRNRRK